MIQNNEIASLTALVSRTHGTLHGIQAQFASMFKGSLQVFAAISFLSDNLSNHMLAQKQRIPALYLIIISYLGESRQNHPFLQILLKTSQQTKEPLERKIIYELLINGNIDNYSSFQLQKYEEYIAKEPQLQNEKEEIIQLKSKLKQKMKKKLKINAPSASENVHILHHNDDRDEDKIVQEHLQLPFLRPCPDFLQIKSSQFHWLSPGIITDVEWDNTSEIDKKMQKVRKIFFTGLSKNLEPKQRNELLNCIQTDPYAPLYLGMKPQYLKMLINNNHVIAASIIIKLSKYGEIQEYLEILLFESTSVSLIDIVGRVIKQIRLPEAYVILFLVRHINYIIKMSKDSEDRKILACTLTAFLRCMVQNQQINPLQLKVQISSFMNEFDKVIDFHPFKAILQKK